MVRRPRAGFVGDAVDGQRRLRRDAARRAGEPARRHPARVPVDAAGTARVGDVERDVVVEPDGGVALQDAVEAVAAVPVEARRQPRQDLALDAGVQQRGPGPRHAGRVLPRPADGAAEPRIRGHADLPVLHVVVAVGAAVLLVAGHPGDPLLVGEVRVARPVGDGAEAGGDRLQLGERRARVAGGRAERAVEPVALVVLPAAGVEVARVVVDVRGVVPPPRELQRRRRVAEQVVGHAEARRDVGPLRHVLLLRERPVPVGEPPQRGRRLLDVRAERLPPQAEVQRQPVDRPGVLHVGPDVAERHPEERRVVGDPHRGRHAVAVLLPQGAVLLQVFEERPPTAHQAELHVVRPGDVRERRVVVEPLDVGVAVAPVVAVLEAVGLLAPGRDRVPGIDGRAVLVHRPLHVQARVAADAGIAGRRLAGGETGGQRLRVPAARRQRRSRGERHVVLGVDVAPVLDVGRVARLEQQPAAQRRRPLRRPDVVEGRAVVARRGRHVLHRAVVVEPLLDDAVHVDRELVVLVHLRGQAQQPAGDAVVVDAGQLLAEVVAVDVHAVPRVQEVTRHRPVVAPREAVGGRLVDLEAAEAAEEPEPVADDGAAHRGVEVVDQVDRLARRGAAILEPRRELVLLQPGLAVAEVLLPAQRVAPLAADHVDPHAAGGGLGRDAARLVDHLLVRQVVVVVLVRPVVARAHHELAVDGDRGLPDAHAVHRHVGLLRRGGQPDLRPVQLDARDQLRGRLQVVPGRDRVEHLAVEHLDPAGRRHVHDGRLAGNRHGFFEGADREHRVDRRHEAGRQFLILDQHGREAGQREGDGVRPGAQVDDGVAARPVGDRDAAPFDQRRTRRLDGHAGQDAAGVVGDLPGDLAAGLGERPGWRQGETGQRNDDGR